MSIREEIINQINSMPHEELEQLTVSPEEEYGLEDADLVNDKLVDLEIEKENRRIVYENSFAESLSNMYGISTLNITDGFNYGSFYAGMYQALIQAGMSIDNAYQIVLNESTIRGNIEIAKVSSDNNTYKTNVMGFQEINPYDNVESEDYDE